MSQDSVFPICFFFIALKISGCTYPALSNVVICTEKEIQYIESMYVNIIIRNIYMKLDSSFSKGYMSCT